MQVVYLTEEQQSIFQRPNKGIGIKYVGRTGCQLPAWPTKEPDPQASLPQHSEAAQDASAVVSHGPTKDVKLE
jgi:hypothetical protein